MAKKVKKEKPKKGFNIFDEDETAAASSEEELPKDEAGRRKIKRQYEDLLGIRIQKLRGRILNRERINKTIEGIYFICAECAKVCHNVDDGLMEDPDNMRNLCGPCSTKPPGARTARTRARGVVRPRPDRCIASGVDRRRPVAGGEQRSPVGGERRHDPAGEIRGRRRRSSRRGESASRGPTSR